MALGMNNFDAIVFLQQFNYGYPMTIEDMAAQFYVIDPIKDGDGNDKIATIDCHNKKGANVGGKAGIVGADDPTLCNHPEFLIKRFVFDNERQITQYPFLLICTNEGSSNDN